MSGSRSGTITLKLTWLAEEVPDNCASIEEEVKDALNYMLNKGTRSEHGVMVECGGIDDNVAGKVEGFEVHDETKHHSLLKYLGMVPEEDEPGYGDVTELGCPICMRDLIISGRYGQSDLDNEKLWPVKQVVETGVGGAVDPTTWYKLECGHVVI